MGEPLSNYEAVKAAVGMMGEPRLFGIGARHITVSTVGVIPRIKQMAADLPVNRQQQRTAAALLFAFGALMCMILAVPARMYARCERLSLPGEQRAWQALASADCFPPPPL
jgi:hypothetical protein